MPEKKYYWLKLHKDFFKQKEIKRLRRIAGGDVYTIIYLKMLLQSLETDGYLYYDGYYDSFEAELADDIDEDEENVKVVISYLLSKGLMEEHEDDSYLLTKCKEMTGSEGGSAARMRRLRGKDKKAIPSQCDAPPSLSDNDVRLSDTEIEKEKELKKEKEIYNNKVDSDFEYLWSLYPKKDGKKNAKTAYTRAVKNGVTKEQVEDGIRRYIRYIEITKQYVKNGSTWFNQECWNDEYKTEGVTRDGRSQTDARGQNWDVNDDSVI